METTNPTEQLKRLVRIVCNVCVMRVTAECVGTLPTIAEEMKNVLCEWKWIMFVCFLGLYGLYASMTMPM